MSVTLLSRTPFSKSHWCSPPRLFSLTVVVGLTVAGAGEPSRTLSVDEQHTNRGQYCVYSE